MVQLTAWPAVTDDDGSGQYGTIGDKAWSDAARDAVEALIHSLTNPTISPADIINEVKAARGSLGTLDGRLDVSLNEDGTLKSQASLVTQAQAKTFVGSKNIVPNGDLLLWSLGDSSAPDYFTLSGAGAAIARTGTGLGDTQRAKYGDFACKITYGSAAAKLTQTLLSTTDFARADGLKNRKVSFGCWAKSSIANHASIVVDDGVTQTRGGQGGNGTYHTGGGALEWLYVTHTVSSSATKLTIYFEVAASGSAYFGNLIGVISDIPPADFFPCAMQKGTIVFKVVGNVTTGTDKDRFLPGAPGIVVEVMLQAKTAPTGQALIVDCNTWDGAAYTSMFSTRPQLAAAASLGGATPDTTYARRCFSAFFAGGSLVAGNIISFDIDQVGSGVPGADLTIHVRTRQYIRELEGWLSYNAA